MISVLLKCKIINSAFAGSSRYSKIYLTSMSGFVNGLNLISLPLKCFSLEEYPNCGKISGTVFITTIVKHVLYEKVFINRRYVDNAGCLR